MSLARYVFLQETADRLRPHVLFVSFIDKERAQPVLHVHSRIRLPSPDNKRVYASGTLKGAVSLGTSAR